MAKGQVDDHLPLLMFVESRTEFSSIYL